MKSTLHFLACILLTCLLSCRDGDSDYDPYYDAAQIEGNWYTAGNPALRYYFSNGRSLQQVVDFGAVLYEIQYNYTTSADTVFQRNFLSTVGFTRTWTVEFPTADSCYVTEWTPAGDSSQNFILVRW